MRNIIQKIHLAEQSLVVYRQPNETHFVMLYGHLVPTDAIPNEDNFCVTDFIGERFCFDQPNKITLTSLGLKDILTQFQNQSVLKANTSIKPTHQTDYQNRVKQSILEITAHQYHKIVHSRTKIISNKISSLYEAVYDLSTAYPEGLITFFACPQKGCWLGASPEILLESDGVFTRTVAIAGTQLSNGKSIKQASWSQKEIEEQALVSRYIINCFKTVRLREYLELGPKTIKTGKLFHLKSTFDIRKSDTKIEHLEERLLGLLHPTSAVCGMPLTLTKNTLLKTEEYNRELYTGYWGPTSKTGFSFYVNIRLAQLFKNQIVLYAGAGITEDSDPEAEWDETESKCDNLALKLMK